MQMLHRKITDKRVFFQLILRKGSYHGNKITDKEELHMVQTVFQRYEKKYLLSEEQFAGLMDGFDQYMKEDWIGTYTISNLYLDTPDYRLIRHSIEKPSYKEKVRLRAYGEVNETSAVFAEIKKKTGGIVYKRRAEMTMAEAGRYARYRRYPDRDSQILRELRYVTEFYGLGAMAFLAYDRMPWHGKGDSDFRVTFDRNIRCRDQALELCLGDWGEPLLEPGQVLMEVKIPGAMPLWMSRRLSEIRVYPVSFSKYGTYYKRLYQEGRVKGGVCCA